MTNKPESASLREKIIAALLDSEIACGQPTADLATAILAAIEQDGEPVAWLMQPMFRGEPQLGYVLSRPNQKALHPTMWTDAFPVYRERPATDAAKDARIAELEAWKASAMFMLDGLDIQAIGKEIGAEFGSDITPQVLPAIRKLRQQLAEQGARLVAAEKDAALYLHLRNDAISPDSFGSFTPYVVRGQTMEVLEGERLDAEVRAAIASTGEKP